MERGRKKEGRLKEGEKREIKEDEGKTGNRCSKKMAQGRLEMRQRERSVLISVGNQAIKKWQYSGDGMN